MKQLLAALAVVAVSVLAATARRTVDYALNRLVDVIPVLVLRLARRRLPAAARDDLYRDWRADLIDRRHDPELTGRPLAQLKSCTRDSLGWLRSGRTIAATYRDPSPGVRLELVQERLRTLCEGGDLPWLRQRDGLRPLALYLRWLLSEPTLAFTAEEKAQLVAAAAITGKLCLDDRDERLGQELVDAAWPHADDLGLDHQAVLHLLNTTGDVALQLGDHDDTLESRKHAAIAAARLGRRHEAIAELRRILDTQRQTQVQGPSHPKTRDTRRWLRTLTQEMT